MRAGGGQHKLVPSSDTAHVVAADEVAASSFESVHLSASAEKNSVRAWCGSHEVAARCARELHAYQCT